MNIQVEQANLLKNLHVKGDPLVLFNVWDAGSAKAMQGSGAKVIATSSWAVAAAQGFDDGEKIPVDLTLSNLKQIIASVDVPVTIDLEGGYGINPPEVQKIVNRVIEAGAVGINFEDQIIGGKKLYSIEEQCARIKAISETVNHTSIPLFINARTDIFLKTDPLSHNDNHLKEAISRANAYAQVGANGFFVPGLRNAKYIEQLCELSPLPVNIMVLPDTPSPKRLVELGVARISYGPVPYIKMINNLKEAARLAFSLS